MADEWLRQEVTSVSEYSRGVGDGIDMAVSRVRMIELALTFHSRDSLSDLDKLINTAKRLTDFAAGK